MANALIIAATLATLLITVIPLANHTKGSPLYGNAGFCSSFGWIRFYHVLTNIRVLDSFQQRASGGGLCMDVGDSWVAHHPVYRQLPHDEGRDEDFQGEACKHEDGSGSQGRGNCKFPFIVHRIFSSKRSLIFAQLPCGLHLEHPPKFCRQVDPV